MRLDAAQNEFVVDRLAARSTRPRTATRVWAELERMRAIVRRRDGRHVRYFMNPLVGTGTGGAAGDEARAEAFPSRSIDGGKA